MVAKYVTTALIVATLGLGTAAMAQPNLGLQRDVGFITDVDKTDKTVTLSDGATYQLPYGFDVHTFKAGQKVAVNWDQVGSTMFASSISFTN
jgi:hypothetical protein